MISNHIILSSARYLFALWQDKILSTSTKSSFDPFKKASSGAPFIHFHLKVEKAPGRTETKPNKLSTDFSR